MGYIDVSEQALTFFMSFGLGALLCLLYDIVRALHKTAVKGFFEVLISDLIFWFVAAFITFCFLILRCQGTVRGFVLFGQLAGFLTVRFTLSRFLIKFFVFAVSIFSTCFRAISARLYKSAALLEKNIKKFFNMAKKVLQPKAKLLYNLLKVRSKRKKASEQTDFKEI